MKPLTLKLQPRTKASPPVVAAWVPASDPGVWLAEIADDDARVLPIVLKDVTIGAIIFGETHNRRSLPLVNLLPNVLGLKSSDLAIGLLDQEIQFSLFPLNLYLFLPGTGPVVIEKSQAFHPGKLVLLTQSPLTWQHAKPARPSRPSLKGIRLELPEEPEIDLENLNESGIGSKSGEKLDKTDPHYLLGRKIAAGIVAGPIIGLGKLLDLLPDGPGTGKGPTPFDKLEAWAKQNWNKIADARQRELDRLMDLLDKDPDAGLKHALPLNGAESRRGNAPPGWQLGQNSITFGSGQSGGPADVWDVNYETRLRLERQYRKAAADATAAEKHERAAYIYGHLLGDWSAAANSLRKAGLHQKAVGVYLHKLHDKRRAAETLEAAGLTLQAAELYLETEEFEKAGDLFSQLGKTELAHRNWTRAVDKEKDPLLKAALLANKLQQIPNAISVLDNSWKAGKRAPECLRYQLELLQNNGDQSGTAALISAFTTAAHLSKIQRVELIGQLKPTVDPQHAAAFREAALRITSAELLENPKLKITTSLLQEFRKLDSSDRLLERDTVRFTTENREIRLPDTQKRSGRIQPEVIIDIPQEGRWQSLAAIGTTVSVAGLHGSQLVVATLQKRQCIGSELKTPDYRGGSAHIHHLGLTSNRHRARVFHFVESKTLHFRSLNSARTKEHDFLGTLKDVLAIGKSDEEDVVVLKYNSTASLVTEKYSARGHAKGSVVLDLAPPEVLETRWHCAENNKHSAFSANNFLAWRYPDGQLATCPISAPVHKMVFSAQNDLLISSEYEAALLIPGKPGKVPEFVQLFISELDDVFATFAKNGDIIIVCGCVGQIFTRDDLLTPAATFTLPSEKGIAIDIVEHGPRGFVVLTNRGGLVVY